MRLGITLYGLRKGLDLSQIKAAEKIGCSQTYLSQIESGRRNPTLSILDRMAKAYGISVPVLFVMAATKDEMTPDVKKLVIINLIKSL